MSADSLTCPTCSDTFEKAVAFGVVTFFCSKHCQLAYFNALKKKKAAKNGIPHGTYSGYQRHKCRCDACKKASSEYLQKFRAQRIQNCKNYRQRNRLQIALKKAEKAAAKRVARPAHLAMSAAERQAARVQRQRYKRAATRLARLQFKQNRLALIARRAEEILE